MWRRRPEPAAEGRRPQRREVTGAAVRSTLNPLSVLGNVPDAIHRVTRTDRVGNNIGDRLFDGFTGLFGIDPLKKR